MRLPRPTRIAAAVLLLGLLHALYAAYFGARPVAVRITKAEDGGLDGKGVWKPATTGYGPSGASSQNQLYLTGALVRIEE